MIISAEVEAAGGSPKTLLAGLTAAALVGAADVAVFIATDPTTARRAAS